MRGPRAGASPRASRGRLTANRPPAASERGRRDERYLDPPVALESQQRPPDRDAPDVVSCPVDRVDDPACRYPVVAELLAEHALTRAPARDELADSLFGGAIGLGDGAQIGLRLDPKVERPEASERDRVGAVSQLLSKGEVRAHGPSRYLTTEMRSPVILTCTTFDQDIFWPPAGRAGLIPRTR